MRTLYFVFFFLVSVKGLIAQPVNDECLTAFHIPNSDSWCSEPKAYTNVNATPFSGSIPANNCFLQLENEVWFTFIPTSPAVYIKVSGNVNNLGTLQNPAIGIFEGSCNNLQRVGCNIVSSTTNQVELSVESLVIGAVYYLLVEGQNDNFGSFQICIEGFIPPPIPQSDCNKAVILCDKSPFVVDTILGIGIQDPDVNTTCVQQELSSVWYTWTAATSGTLTFTLTPNGYQQGFESDDIDFVVYELPGGLEDCNNKVMLRCMAAGANVNEPFQNWKRCNGPTGLASGSTDVVEPPGCRDPSQDNFVAPLDMIAGRSYALLVNNFSQSGLGFSIEWGGTGTFLGPEPSFDVTAVQAFECDKTIIFDNQSTAPTDSIVRYEWGFGAGATPLFDTTSGPISVVYKSFGQKRAILTVTSSKGCVVTKVIDFFIEPCCADTSTLDVAAATVDQICPGTATGVIQGIGISGSPNYQFSLDCENYQPSTVFPALLPGSYTLCIQDQKGCQNQVEVTILPASGFGVEAGDTLFVQLGNTTQIHATAFPTPSSVTWNHLNNLTFNGTDINSLLSPIALPTTTAWYTVTIINDAGCVDTDSVLIVVDAYKPIFIPNVITPNNDGTNDKATVYGNVAATGVEVFEIYDRWGGLMWDNGGVDILNDESLGWDGTARNDQPVSPGVYAYRAVVNFLDDIPVTYTGTITVLE